MKKIYLFPIALVTVLLVSCSNTHEEVISTYDDGSPKLVYIMQGKKDENQQKVGERMFYQDGTLRWNKHFADASNTGKWQYYYENGQLFAEGDFSQCHETGCNWLFYNAEGGALLEGKHDSVVVSAFNTDMFPLTVGFFHGDSISVIEFYEDLCQRSSGTLVKGKRSGHWTFYFPSGVKQAEAIYIDGVENGMHCAYRENGVPYFRGLYINGKRAGVWEFYDQDGRLSGKQNFDKPLK